MPNQFQILGSNSDKPQKGVPLAISELFSGYWPNSSPYRDAAVAYLYARFYGASRNDKISAGLNTELSPQLTLIRRPGCTVYNSNTFTDVTGFYSFKPFVAGLGEQVYVIVDTATAVYIGSVNSTSANTLLYTKATGAGTSRFQGEGNTLYWGDGINTTKWTWFPAWTASTVYPAGQCILDASNRMQQSLGYSLGIVSTSVSSNICTVVHQGLGTVAVGDTVTFYGLTGQTALNGLTVSVLTSISGGSTGTITFQYNTSNYTTTSDTGLLVDLSTSTAATSGTSTPSFSSTRQGVVLDGDVGWICWGSSVQNMGIVAPTTAPTLSITPVPTAPLWAASTYYWPEPLIVDSNSTPYVWNLTTAGTTNTSVPSGLTTGTPTPQYSAGTISATPTTVTDGTAVWTCNSLATRAPSTIYSVGQVIAVTWTYTYNTTVYRPGRPGQGGNTAVTIPHSVTYNSFFECSVGGATSSSSTANISWSPALLSTTLDGNVTWVNAGLWVTRLAATTTAPTGGGVANQVPGNVGDSQLVSTTTEIQDSNQFGEIPSVAGVSGSTAPTWATALGAGTAEPSGLIWENEGSLGAPNTGNWFYSYTYVNPATNDESSGSPLSKAVLLPASSGVIISGVGSTDTQVGAINIYRSVQEPTGSTSGTPFFLTQIPAPVNGGPWHYTDITPDPPNPGAILNVLITCPGYGLVDGLVTNYNDPPPTGLTNFTFHAGRMWGTAGNLSYYSTGPDVTSGNGNTSWSALNFNEVPGTLFALWPTTVGLFHFSNDGMWLVQGLGSSSTPFEPIQLVDASLSLSSSNAFCINGTQALVYTSDRLYIQIDPSQGTTWLGQPVATDLISGYSPTSVFLTYHSNGLDQKGYITNGSNSWLSWAQVPAPETGVAWNPPATINAGSAGVGAIASVETSPGIYKLLIGASGTGVILARDSTFSTFTDDGNAYSSWAAFGNIVLAHHGQMAEVIHLGADFYRVGSMPVVSVLLDEILNQQNTPSWDVITNPVNDPPGLLASSTLYQLRYWMIESQQPIQCRNALFKFDFGTDTVKNELLTFTIFGESLEEGE